MTDKTGKQKGGQKKVTLKDVAERANVSYATVSRALNQIEDRFISENTRRLVMETAFAMGYQPNRQARSLVTRRNLTLGIVFPSLGQDVMMSPFIHQTLNGCLNEAERLGQDILLLSAADRNQPEGRPQEVVDSRIDGLIFIAPPTNSCALAIVEQQEMPYAVIGGRTPGRGLLFNIDNRGGTRQALDHLTSLGHQRIAHIAGMQNQVDGLERLESYMEYMEEQGLPYPPDYIVKGNFRVEGGADGIGRLLSLPNAPTAVFCANDGTAFGVIRAAAQHGLRVPEDLSVVGFDDHYLSPVFTPPLTTVRQPLDQMGAAALEAVVLAAKGQEVERQVVFSTELVVRSSTAPS